MPRVRITNSDWRRTTWLENLDAADSQIRFAIKEIKRVYDADVSVNVTRKSIRKFGYTAQAGGSSQVTVMTLGTNEIAEDYVADNTITHVASSSTAVVGVATISGHTIDTATNDLTPVSQTVTLAGQTKTALTTPLARASRIVNNSTLDWASNVYVARDVTFTNGIPQDSSAIHLIGVAADNQSQKAALAFGATEYGILTSVYAFLNKNSGATASADIRLKVRPEGEVFQTKWLGSVNSNSNSVRHEFDLALIVPPNADVILTADSSGTSVEISGGFTASIAETV